MVVLGQVVSGDNTLGLQGTRVLGPGFDHHIRIRSDPGLSKISSGYLTSNLQLLHFRRSRKNKVYRGQLTRRSIDRHV